MVFLWVFGDDVERALGRVRYLAFYLLCGAIGGLVFVANDPHSAIELIGASGAVARVGGGFVMLRPRPRVPGLPPLLPPPPPPPFVAAPFLIPPPSHPAP